MAPSSHFSPKGRLELSSSEETFPNNLGHHKVQWGLPPGHLTGLSKECNPGCPLVLLPPTHPSYAIDRLGPV